MPLRAHLIRHTHWDREWYLPQEVFRTRLVRLIDALLEAVDANPDTPPFMLDGQAIAIVDYLAVKPYNRARLEAAMQSGKIVCGPWYVLPDELLVSGESHIRNYLMGQSFLAHTGGMRVAYLPDSFGHPAQMPQIIAGLGMDTMLFWRGVPGSIRQTEFYWNAPGSVENGQTLCIHMPHGYGNCANLSADMEETAPRLERLLNSLASQSVADVVLLMNGSDHISGQADIADVVAQANLRLDGEPVVLSDLQSFVRQLRAALPASLPEYAGEMRAGERSMLLGGTISTRMPLKQQNEDVQKTAERYLEPLLCTELLLGGTADSSASLPYLWQKILENHPHDSICGCSLDAVHNEMDTRFACTRQLEESLLEETAGRIIGLSGADDGCAQLLFEPCTTPAPQHVEVDVSLDSTLVQYVDYARSLIVDREAEIAHPDLSANIAVTDELGRDVHCVVLDSKKDYITRYQDHTMPEVYKVNRFRLALCLPAFSFGVHRLRFSASETPPVLPRASENAVIENEYYHITVKNNAFDLLEKRSGRLHTGVAKLIDTGDAGDEYSYSWPLQDKTCTLEAGGVATTILPGIGRRITLRGGMRLPASLSADRRSRTAEEVFCPVALEAMLTDGLDRVDFTLTFENNAADHRLQVQFPAGTRVSGSESYSTFHVTERPVEAPVPEFWMEYPQNTHPTHGFVSLGDDNQGVCVSSRGITEFEAVQLGGETALNLTLLRSVGWLSRTDLASRKGNGGWTIATPGAQCRGTHVFHFAAQYHDGTWREANSFALLERHRLPPFIANCFPAGFAAPENPLAFLDELPEGICVSAVKPAENGDGIVLRLYSTAEQAKEVCFSLPPRVSEAFLCNLAEQSPQTVPLDETGKIRLPIRPWQIVTIRFPLGERSPQSKMPQGGHSEIQT